jgi:competence protein ComGC
MKIALTISLALNLLFIFLIWEQNTESSIKLKAKEAEVKYHQSKADSASLEKQLTKDSLSIAFETIRVINGEKEKAHQETVKWRDKYNFERGKRVSILSDAGYDSAINSLYPH